MNRLPPASHASPSGALTGKLVAGRPSPDLRAVEYRPIDVVWPAVNGHRPRASTLRQLVTGVLHTLVRVTVGVFSTSS